MTGHKNQTNAITENPVYDGMGYQKMNEMQQDLGKEAEKSCPEQEPIEDSASSEM